MDENREALFEEIEAFFDKNGGFPSEWVEEFDNILEDDSFDK